MNNARKQYEVESDSVQLFLEDKTYQASPTAYITIKSLYTEYRTFCMEDGFLPVNKTSFKKRLQHSKIAIGKKNVGDVAYLSSVIAEYKNFG
ncbi:MAG: primase-like DNA-binding domain-containing protein [Legionella sp.]